MTHPKAGEWWCPGIFRGNGPDGPTHAGCDGDADCRVCGGRSLETVLEGRVYEGGWIDREWNGWQGRALRGWACLMASRYSRPVYLVGGALEDPVPRDFDVRVILSGSEFEARFGKWKTGSNASLLDLDEMDVERRWHVEMAKMNKQGSSQTRLLVDFQVQPMVDAARFIAQKRRRLDDVPELAPPWED